MKNRVLLVDDDESILFALTRIVSRRGWEPLTARSGADVESFESVLRAVPHETSLEAADVHRAAPARACDPAQSRRRLE
jgi:ActR/RegA family two-component response regulator